MTSDEILADYEDLEQDILAVLAPAFAAQAEPIYAVTKRLAQSPALRD